MVSASKLQLCVQTRLKCSPHKKQEDSVFAWCKSTTHSTFYILPFLHSYRGQKLLFLFQIQIKEKMNESITTNRNYYKEESLHGSEEYVCHSEDLAKEFQSCKLHFLESLFLPNIDICNTRLCLLSH